MTRTASGTRAAVLAAGLTLGTTLVAAPTALAADDPEAAVSSTGVVTAAERAVVTDYWTPERMESATPGAVLVDEDEVAEQGSAAAGEAPAVGVPDVVEGALGAVGPTTTGLFAAPAAADATGVPWTAGGQVVATTGKVFFTLGGGDYVCSASSVAADNAATVLTAGHCVYGEGEHASNFTYVPGYDDGAAPYGEWTAEALVTTPQYEASEDLDFDVAFAVLSPVGGRELADVVGAQGIAFNQPRGQQMHSFGYPAAPPYDGESLQYCSGQVRQDTFGGSGDQGLTCAMTGGSSGGPWYAGFDESTGTGTAGSLNSFKYTVDASTMYGPYFGAQAQETYEVASTS